MMDCTIYLMLVLMINIQVLPNYAVTLVPPSITACHGQTVLTFNCTVNVDGVRWNVFTPVRNYTNLRVPVVDGDVVTSEVSRTLNPLEVVSSLTITVTAELNGSEVQCFTETSEGIIKDSGFIYFAVPPGSIELRDPNVSDVVFGRTTITSITISWTLLELEGVDYNTSITPTIPFQKASNTSIVIFNVPYNTQYTITVVASNCLGSSMDTISINYSECGPPVAADDVVVHNYTTTFEGSSITFTCEDGFLPSGIITANCTGEGHWSTDPATYMCINITNTATTDTSGIATGTTTTNITAKVGASNLPLVIGVVVPVIFMLATIIIAIIVIAYIIMRHKYTLIKNKRYGMREPGSLGDPMMSAHDNSLVPHEGSTKDSTDPVLVQEYSLVSHEGGTWDNTAPEQYNILQHNQQRTKPGQVSAGDGDAYSHIHHDNIFTQHHDATTTTNTTASGTAGEYSVLGSQVSVSTPSSVSTPAPSGGIIYADIGIHHKNVSSQRIPEPNIVYSTITGTIAPVTKMSTDPDGSLDLNMLLIQICEIKSHWYPYGEALGVSPKLLDEVKEMQLEDYDKLVEVLDAYFRTHSQDPPPTWKEIAEALRVIGYEKMAVNIMKVYITGNLPIEVDDNIGGSNEPPPPVPPKTNDSFIPDETPPTTSPPPLPNKSDLTPPRPPKRKK